jgi:hypothetical protein
MVRGKNNKKQLFFYNASAIYRRKKLAGRAFLAM